MLYDVRISARKEGAIGVHNTELRRYTVEAPTLDDVNKAAIDAAYKEGGLEHVSVYYVAEHGKPPHNNNCDGAHCNTSIGEVRVYPLGGGGNLILCHSCWAHENQYNYNRGRETRNPKNWPQKNWFTAKVYGAVE